MATVIGVLYPVMPATPGVHPTALIGRGVRLGAAVHLGPRVVVGDGAEIGDRVVLGPGVVLGDGVTIGEDSVLDANVVCYAGTAIGKRGRIKAGAVLGGVGFGYLSDRHGHHQIPHVGGCLLGDDVHVGANCAIDRGSVGDTMVGSGTKLDNHVHIGHNAVLGDRCLVMGGSVVAGSARIGNDVILAGHTAVGGHLTVGDRARIGAKSGVTSDVPPGADFTGFPARSHREFLRAQAALHRLAPIAIQLESLLRRHD
jgi:UDP-3-O-[3-hydroxymyristoyl] glucosamine N-acyltransferase